MGWCGPFSGHGRAPERGADVVAPDHRQALPHPSVWMLKSWHPGRSSWCSAEPRCRQLEGNGFFKVFSKQFGNVFFPEVYLLNVSVPFSVQRIFIFFIRGRVYVREGGRGGEREDVLIHFQRVWLPNTQTKNSQINRNLLDRIWVESDSRDVVKN